MYESSCSYHHQVELKRAVKTEDCVATVGGGGVGVTTTGGTVTGAADLHDWTAPYRFSNSTFEQLKQSVEKAKAALQDRSSFLGGSSAFSELYSRSHDPLQEVGLGKTRDLQDTGTSTNNSEDHKRTLDLERSEKTSHSHLSSPKSYNIGESLMRTSSKCGIVYVILDGAYESGIFGDSNRTQQIVDNAYVSTIEPIMATYFEENTVEHPAGYWNKLVFTIFGFVLQSTDFLKDNANFWMKKINDTLNDTFFKSNSIESDKAVENGNTTGNDEAIEISGDDEDSSIESASVEGTEDDG